MNLSKEWIKTAKWSEPEWTQDWSRQKIVKNWVLWSAKKNFNFNFCLKNACVRRWFFVFTKTRGHSLFFLAYHSRLNRLRLRPTPPNSAIQINTFHDAEFGFFTRRNKNTTDQFKKRKFFSNFYKYIFIRCYLNQMK